MGIDLEQLDAAIQRAAERISQATHCNPKWIEGVIITEVYPPIEAHLRDLLAYMERDRAADKRIAELTQIAGGV